MSSYSPLSCGSSSSSHWHCQIGCNQSYRRSSGRSIRRHVLACFRQHHPECSNMSDQSLSSVIGDLQIRGELFTGLKRWTMRRSRRASDQLPDGERWQCPNQCGKCYRSTSTASILRHVNRCSHQHGASTSSVSSHQGSGSTSSTTTSDTLSDTGIGSGLIAGGNGLFDLSQWDGADWRPDMLICKSETGHTSIITTSHQSYLPLSSLGATSPALPSPMPLHFTFSSSSQQLPPLDNFSLLSPTPPLSASTLVSLPDSGSISECDTLFGPNYQIARELQRLIVNVANTSQQALDNHPLLTMGIIDQSVAHRLVSESLIGNQSLIDAVCRQLLARADVTAQTLAMIG